MENRVEIVVSSDDKTIRALFSNIVHKAVSDAGFANVEIMNPDAEHLPVIEVATLLELVEARHPDAKDLDIVVWSTPEPEFIQKMAMDSGQIGVLRAELEAVEEAAGPDTSNY